MEYGKPKKYVSKADALKKLQRYCAYQDRCHQEVRDKLLGLGIYGEDLEEILCELIEDNFLNEERFARSYARGKFRHKQWGRVRIQSELKRRQISAYCIKIALTEIDESAYPAVLEEVLQKYLDHLEGTDPFQKWEKLVRHGMRRGFEYELVAAVAKKLLEKP